MPAWSHGMSSFLPTVSNSGKLSRVAFRLGPNWNPRLPKNVATTVPAPSLKPDGSQVKDAGQTLIKSIEYGLCRPSAGRTSVLQA